MCKHFFNTSSLSILHLTWALSAHFPIESCQTWRSWTLITFCTAKRSCHNKSISTSSGEPSSTTLRQSLMILTVVPSTSTLNMNVQIGSIISQSGFKNMMKLAITIPIDWIMSPRIWMNAALTLTFSVAVVAMLAKWDLSFLLWSCLTIVHKWSSSWWEWWEWCEWCECSWWLWWEWWECFHFFFKILPSGWSF